MQLEAVRMGERPHFAKEDERIVYDVTNELSADRRISQGTFDRAIMILGLPRLVALVNGISFYTMVCMGVVAFEVPVPDQPGLPAPLPPLLARK